MIAHDVNPQTDDIIAVGVVDTTMKFVANDDVCRYPVLVSTMHEFPKNRSCLSAATDRHIDVHSASYC